MSMGRLAPLRWFGGKYHLANKLLPLIPDHHTYVEVFGGGAMLLFAKAPSPVEVYNDIDGGLVNFFRVIRDEKKFKQFHRLVSLTPYSREEYYFCRDTWESIEDDVERAYRWYVVARMGFSGDFSKGGWSFAVTASVNGMAQPCWRWLSGIDKLPEIHKRIIRVQIEHYDWRKILEIYDTEDTFFYCDPPYILSTRRSGGYRYEMTNDDHKELVAEALRLKGKVMLSGYDHPIYKPLEDAGWSKRQFDVACVAAGRTRATGLRGAGSASHQRRTECVWMNYEIQRKLF